MCVGGGCGQHSPSNNARDLTIMGSRLEHSTKSSRLISPSPSYIRERGGGIERKGGKIERERGIEREREREKEG